MSGARRRKTPADIQAVIKSAGDYCKKLSALKTQCDQAAGAVSELAATLKTKFKCNSLSEAERKEAELRKDVEGMTTELSDMIEEFKTKWPDEEEEEDDD